MALESELIDLFPFKTILIFLVLGSSNIAHPIAKPET